MTVEERFCLLVDFLKENNAKDQYVYNVEHYSIEPLNNTPTKHILNLCESDDCDNVFVHAFNWSQTVEGRGYWSQLLFKWSAKFK